MGIGIDDIVIRVLGIDQKVHIVGILNAGEGIGKSVFCVSQFLLQVFLKGLQIIFRGLHIVQGVNHLRHNSLGVDRILFVGIFIRGNTHKGLHQGGDIHGCGFQGERIRGKGILLHCVDIGGHTVGHGKNQGNADNADGACKGGQHSTALFGEQVFQGQPECSRPGHRGLPHTLFSTKNCPLLLFANISAFFLT